MQYCSLQHQTLLPSPVTSTAGCCFCFGSVSSFFLELFLHCSPVAYWAPTNLVSSVSYLFAFSYCFWETPGHSWASLGQSLVGSLLPSPGSWCTQAFVCAFQKSVSPVFSRSILGTYCPGEFIFQCHIFLPFHPVHGVLEAGILKWFAIPFSSGPQFV